MSDFLPLILLFLFGGFAVVTALLKTRARVKSPLGIALTVLEGISGLALMGASLPGSGSLETASRIGLVAAALVAVSSTVHLMKVSERNRAREASLGRRLQTAIKYPIGDMPSVTGGEVAEPDASTALAEPDASTEPTEPDASTELTEPDASTELTEPDASTELAEPDASTELTEPDASTDLAGDGGGLGGERS